MSDNGGDRSDRDRELFDRVASSWELKDLHPPSARARRRRLEASLESVPWDRIESVIEVGCGAGFAAPVLSAGGRRYTGIDHSRVLVDRARRRHGGPDVRFDAADAREWSPLEPTHLVLFVGVLHHVEGWPDLVRRAADWLRVGGWILANEPRRGNLAIDLLRWLRAKTDPAYSAEQRPMTASELRAAFERAGLEEIETAPQGIVSTPFAEVRLRPVAIAEPASRLACATDRFLEERLRTVAGPLSWNVVARGRRGKGG